MIENLTAAQKKELEDIVEKKVGYFGLSAVELSDGTEIEQSDVEHFASAELHIETCGTCGYVTAEGEYDFDDCGDCVCHDCDME